MKRSKSKQWGRSRTHDQGAEWGSFSWKRLKSPDGTAEEQSALVDGTLDEVDSDMELLQRKASSNAEYVKITTNAHDIHDVAVDCWGAMVFIIVSDLPDCCRGSSLSLEEKTRIVFGFSFFCINLLIQGVLLYFIVCMLMMPSFREAQDLYRDFHARAFEHGKLVPAAAPWPELQLLKGYTDDSQSQLCGLALTYSVFTRVIIFLWVCTTLGELINVIYSMHIVVNLASLPSGIDPRLMVHELKVRKKVEYQVICLNSATRFWLMAIIYLPKMIIAVVLMVIGSLWLLASQSLTELILNSLALEFVISVDELLANVFFPRCFVDQLETLEFACRTDPNMMDEQKAAARRTKSYLQSLGTLALSISIVEAMLHFQPVLPYFKDDVQAPCLPYMNQQKPWCFPFNTDCFKIAP